MKKKEKKNFKSPIENYWHNFDNFHKNSNYLPLRENFFPIMNSCEH